jgi:hypothetical protein
MYKFSAVEDQKGNGIRSSPKCFPVVKSDGKKKKGGREPSSLANDKAYPVYVQYLPVRETAVGS